MAANERGWLALLSPAPLGALAIGQGDVYPNYIKVTARALDALASGDQIEHPLAVASGQFDVAFVILFLYPLLIFAVSFDLTATERDQGTLRMVLSQPVTLRDCVAGKMIVRALTLLVPVLLIPIAAAALTSRVDGDFWIRAALWSIATIVYGAVWHGIALVVNARGLGAPANALTLAGTWLLFAVVGPSCVNLLIAVKYPMPSRVEAAVQARAATEEATVQGSRQLGQFLQDHPTSGNVGREGMRQFALLQSQRDRQVAARLEAVEGTFNAQLEKQRRLASWLSVLSPTMVAQGVFLDIAGTSTIRFDRFRAEASSFQRQWRAYFEPRVLDAATLTPAEYAGAPSFVYLDESAAPAARRIAMPIIAMAAIAIVLLVSRLPRLSRIRVVIEAIDLTKTFGATLAVDHLNLTIKSGEVFCLLGANGAGKTTTINLFLNFVAPTSGTARIGGLSVVEHPVETKQRLAYIPEQVTLYRNLTGLENLRFFSRLAGAQADSDEELLAILAQAGLTADQARGRVSAYSKGMRQKVGIAITIAKGARALLLDEPTSGLDPKASNDFSTLLADLSGRGVAILMATHDLFRAKESGTSVGIMKHGRLVETLGTAELGHRDLEQIYLAHMKD